MNAGRELDALVAEKVMGLVDGVDFCAWPEHDWKKRPDGSVDDFGYDGDRHNGPSCERCWYSYCEHCQKGPTLACEKDPPQYSGNILTAWKVMEKMAALGYDAETSIIVSSRHSATYDTTEYSATFKKDGEIWETPSEDGLPLCICLAALAALGVTVE